MCCRYRIFSSKINQKIIAINMRSLWLNASSLRVQSTTLYIWKDNAYDLCAVSSWLMILNRPLSFSFRRCLPCKNNHSLVKYSSCPHRNRPKNPSIVKHNNIGVKQNVAIKAILDSQSLFNVLQVWQNPFPLISTFI